MNELTVDDLLSTLSAEEQAYIADFFTTHDYQNDPPDYVGLKRYIDSWERLIYSFEQHLDRGLLFEEYHNFLDCRDILAELDAEAPARLQEGIAAVLASLDARFRAATYQIAVPIWKPRNNWWWWRVPRVLGEVLRTGLVERGIPLDPVAE